MQHEKLSGNINHVAHTWKELFRTFLLLGKNSVINNNRTLLSYWDDASRIQSDTPQGMV